MDLQGVRVLVTGGRGFLGAHVTAAVRARGGDAVPVGSAEADLTDRDEALRLVRDVSPVVSCTARPRVEVSAG